MWRARKSGVGSKRGGSALEMALLMPWYIFLFVGAYDWGFYNHALISAEAAARAAALYAAGSNTTTQTAACIYAANELKISSNVPANTTCTAAPLVVTLAFGAGADGQQAASVTVKYQTLSLIPIPLILGKQFWISRTVQMRLRS